MKFIIRTVSAGLLATALALLGTPAALAQYATVQAVVVLTCGTAPHTYTAGKPAPLTIDVNGNLCSSGGGGGGGGTVTQGPQASSSTGNTWFVQQTGALPAGTNVIGHVIADTGSTTAVTSLPTLPAGTNVIGHVITDTGSTTAVTALPALIAGSAIIGNVRIDQTTIGTTDGFSLVAVGSTTLGTPVAYGSTPTGNALSVNAFITNASSGGTGGAAMVMPPTVTTGTLVKGTTAAMTGTTSTQVIAATASKVTYVTSIHCNNSSLTVGTLVSIQDGSGGTVLDTLAAGSVLGGDNRNGGVLPLFWTTSGNGLFAADVTTGASVICQAAGYAQ